MACYGEPPVGSLLLCCDEKTRCQVLEERQSCLPLRAYMSKRSLAGRFWTGSSITLYSALRLLDSKRMNGATQESNFLHPDETAWFHVPEFPGVKRAFRGPPLNRRDDYFPDRYARDHCDFLPATRQRKSWPVTERCSRWTESEIATETRHVPRTRRDRSSQPPASCQCVSD